MIIICPNCNARYELAANAIGNAGRKVQCANCQTSWRAFPEPEPAPVAKAAPDPAPKPGAKPEAKSQAKPETRAKSEPDAGKTEGTLARKSKVEEDDSLFDALAEAELDAVFEKEARKNPPRKEKAEPAAETTKALENGEDEPGEAQGVQSTQVPAADGEDEDAVQKRREALQKRHEVLARNLPHSKFRRWFRMSAGVLLMTLFLGLFLFRDGLVWAFPQLAGLYQGVGIEVNVIGIEFKSVNTVRALRDGVETLMIKADLVNVSSRQVNVPRVRVELIGADGNLLYEWNATPQARVLRPSESVEFSAQLASPPLDAVDMRLGFVENQGEAAIP
ncbi:MAG: zinc-ribbon domain-containing protein [Hyphomicrobiaceae bacterium]|nr:zinc-ribbon domain-containing protein [Hyphomicrobiaceae bacterium]MCC0023687.1 zinc-ribbon domain-containing protein [Hyphomicrobiaceae bacterium]